MNRIVGTLLIALAFVAAGSAAARADTLDCTSGNCQSSGAEFILGGVTYAKFAGAIWSTTDIQPTGSGVIDSFVRIGGNTEVVDGMNTTYRTNGPNKGLLNDEKTDLTFTHDLQKTEITQVTLPKFDGSAGTETYYQFLLDINQTGSDPLLSMSAVKICTSSQGSQASVVDNCTGTQRYNMDSAQWGSGDNNVMMDYNLNSGSGSGDLFMYIPTQYFGNNGKYVYLWSQFGLPGPEGTNNDGYEEWAVRRAPGSGPGTPTLFNGLETPEPASLILLGSGLVAGSGYLRRSRKKAAAPRS